MNYIERFQIPLAGNYAIAQEKDRILGTIYSVWSGGSKVATANHKNDARAIIHDHAKEELGRRINSLTNQIQLAHTSQNTLGDDMFNLGAFKKPA